MYTTKRRLPLRRTSWYFVLTMTISLLLLSSCTNKRKPVDVDPAFSKYIEAYTSGVVSKKTTIRIRLAVDAPVTHSLHETLEESLFSFSPSVEGKAYWVDARTIEFKPEKDLVPDEFYEVSFKLGKVLSVPSTFKTFRFNVQAIKPSFQVEENGLRSIGKDRMILSGQVTTADVEASDAVEKVLHAHLNDNDIAIKWQHNEVTKIHSYTIENIIRNNRTGKLSLMWDGSALNADTKGEKEISVPDIGDFKVMDVRVVQAEEQYVLVEFSDPLTNGQTLDGLITVSNQENPSYTIAGSQVKVYSSNHYDGDYSVTVNEGIVNEWGDKLDKAFSANIFFENRLPSVKIQGKGVLLPNSGGKVVLPFESVNLKAVDIAIIKIFENNIPQFLQSSTIEGGGYELRNVARPLVEATVKLDDDKSLDLHKKNRFLLDLDKYIKTEPGAIYRVRIAFRPAYSLQTCTEMASARTGRNEYDGSDYASEGGNDDDNDFWRRYDQSYPYGYNWEQRNNPCNKAYYNGERFASRNIVATNIGLSAKRGNDNSLFVVVNNLISTDPMSNVELQVLDFQQQVVGKGSSNSDGIAMIPVSRKPYLLIAKKGTERSYLRIDDGSALPLSRFDVNGTEVKNGIKGFIFGERGVWRPGDSLFLSCIIEDKNQKLPADHPIELELLTPEGQLYKRIVATYASDGFNVFKTATDVSAPTGNWLCRVKAGGAVFEKRLKIETVMPNRLKIDLSFGKEGSLGKNASGNGTLTAKWLFGATAQNLKARVDAQLYRKQTAFPNFKGYVFDNPVAAFAPQSKTIFDGTLNAEGVASVNPSFDAGTQAPGMLLANLTVKVFEPGGNFSIDNIALPYHPYSSYAGVKAPEGDQQWGFLLSGRSHSFAVADVNTDGTPVTGKSNMEISLYKIQWRWWWDNSGDNLSNFTQDQYTKLIKKEKLTIDNGKGAYSVKIDGGYGRYMLLVKDTRSGHTTGKVFYIDSDDWQSRSDGDAAGAIAMLSFTADKTKYNTGDKVNLTIPSSEGGRCLISIETGSKVIKTYWVNTTKGQTKFSFKTEKEMSPNVYVNVSLIQPHAQTINDLPIRMYGVLPIMIEDKNTILKPVIQASESIRPEQNASITVSESNHKKMSYVIAIVDEGLLDLTRFKTPDPHENFYAKEALGVKSWDVYDYVIGAWGGELQRILTIGGDGEGELSSKTRRANRFKPVVKFMGPFTSNGSSRTHSFTLPPYMGSVRAMVIAANEGSYGMAEKTIKVKKPLMLLATLPRILGPSEELKIPVTVFATETSIKNVNLRLQSNPFIEATGDQNISFAKTGEQVAYFTARVKSKTGIGKIKVTASSGKETAVYEIEIDIRNPNPVVTQVTEATLQPGQSWTNTTAMIGEGNSSKATLEISSIPAINLQKRLNYLIQYPHGCIEQTTSSVFPQLFLHQLMELNSERKSEIDRNIRAAIQKIQNFQTPNGGFSYWPGENDDDEWGSNYAGHFLLEASARGYNVPASVLQQWRSYQHSKAVAWNVTVQPGYGIDLAQAYRLYLLALNKSPEIGAMNRLKEYKFITVEAKWRLAAAYYLVGQTQVALQLISGLPTTFSERTYWGISYGSNLRDEAMVLETLTIMNRRAEATQLVRTIAADLAQDNWYSTQTTAYGLLAIAKYSGSIKDNVKINASGKAGGQTLSISSSSSISQTVVSWQGGKANTQLTNNGKNVLYVRVINEGQPLSTEIIPSKSNPDILEVSATYQSTTGNTIDPTKIKQGTDFVAKVTIKNPGRRGMYTQMALTQLFPGGWEILNTRLYNSEGGFKSSESQYMDIRDDRVYHYFNIKAGESLTYYVQLNAAYLGKYYWPGVYCEAMYDHTISSNISGRWVEVEQ
ncbi:MAG: MG2 domain-containing protein [Bacteroidota bacterium]